MATLGISIPNGQVLGKDLGGAKQLVLNTAVWCGWIQLFTKEGSTPNYKTTTYNLILYSKSRWEGGELQVARSPVVCLYPFQFTSNSSPPVADFFTWIFRRVPFGWEASSGWKMCHLAGKYQGWTHTLGVCWKTLYHPYGPAMPIAQRTVTCCSHLWKGSQYQQQTNLDSTSVSAWIGAKQWIVSWQDDMRHNETRQEERREKEQNRTAHHSTEQKEGC